MEATPPPLRNAGAGEDSDGGLRWLGALLGEWRSLTRLGAFILITLATAARRHRDNSEVMRPQVMGEIHRCGVRLLPIISFLGVILGVVFVGQTVSLMEQFGAGNFTGTLIVSVLFSDIV